MKGSMTGHIRSQTCLVRYRIDMFRNSRSYPNSDVRLLHCNTDLFYKKKGSLFLCVLLKPLLIKDLGNCMRDAEN